MALTAVGGFGTYWPHLPAWVMGNGANVLNNSALTIDATGEKAAFVGRHWNASRATKSIRKVGILFGNVTKAGGSGLTLSLQDVDAVTGNPLRPDGTQDQTVAIAAADVTASTWYLTGALSADRSVTFGELLSVVIEFDGGGRLGADSFAFCKFVTSATATQLVRLQTTPVLYTASWAESAGLPALIFEYDDGTFGTLAEALPASAASNSAINSGTTPDEAGCEFTVPFPLKADGGWFGMSPAAGADFDIVLYEGTSAMTNGTISFDNDQFRSDGNYQVCEFTFPAELTLATGSTYRLVVKPTTATSVTLPYIDVSAAGHLAVWPGGTNWVAVSRTDAGAFSTTTTRRYLCGLRVSALDNGAGGGGIPIVGGNIIRVHTP